VDLPTGDVWLSYWRTGRIVRLHFRAEEQMAAARKAVSRLKVASASTEEPVTAHPLSGERLYFKECSLCHTGVAPTYKTLGPVLSKDVVATFGENGVADIINRGTEHSPGFRYTLNPAEVGRIVQYLKSTDTTQVRQ
jgi:mono/diheme cytochrome c family protein